MSFCWGGRAPPHTRGSPQSATAASWPSCSPRAWRCLAIPFHLLPDSSNDRFTTGFCNPPTAASSLSRGSVSHLNAGEQGDVTGACFPTTGPVARTALLASGPLHLCCQSTASFCCRCCCRCLCTSPSGAKGRWACSPPPTLPGPGGRGEAGETGDPQPPAVPGEPKPRNLTLGPCAFCRPPPATVPVSRALSSGHTSASLPPSCDQESPVLSNPSPARPPALLSGVCLPPTRPVMCHPPLSPARRQASSCVVPLEPLPCRARLPE